MTSNTYLVWLEWPEQCFHVDADALRYLRTLVPANSRIIRVREESTFLKNLPKTTHAIVWNFKTEWYARAPLLRVVATPAAGHELVSIKAPKGVQVHFGHFHGLIMSESVLGFMLAWARGFFLTERTTLNWARVEMSHSCFSLAGTFAVIVGRGKIGGAIREKLEMIGVRTVNFGRDNIADLPEIAKAADWFIMALPSDTKTDDFLDAALLRKLPRRCVVINVGRGNAVDESALIEALRKRKIAGAYLDVFKDEPGPLAKIVATHGRARGILAMQRRQWPKNLICTPHTSAFAGDYMKRAFSEMKDDGIL